MLTKEYKAFLRAMKQVIPSERMTTDPLYTLAYGTDASFYRMVPKIVITVEEEREVVWLLREAGARNLPVTFRAAGTSLSGQAVTDSILVRLGHTWQGCAIFDNADKIRLQPGVIGSWANSRLGQFGRKIGPDPASIDTAQIGGIVANNASGMCCGVSENSYKTIADIRAVFYDGTVLDTEDDASRSRFADEHPNMLKGICDLRDAVKANPELADRIRRKFKIKNTTGYSLNALVDFDDPFDIIKHLLVGSEGTLGFISSVTYHTVVEHPHKASALLLFPDIETACNATMILKKQPVAAVELMDRAALKSVEDKEGMPPVIKGLADGVTALLVETRAETREALAAQVETVTASLAGLTQVVPTVFTPDPEEFTRLWAIRKGLFPAVGAVRETGTTVIIEDVAFPMDSLASATLELQALFKKYRYDEAIIFGHALEGNLHFVFTQAFEEQDEINRYRDFMDEVAGMVVTTYDGSLKAEHGTGRNMAPYVEMEWGREAYALMKEIKALFDPRGILNPGVILNDDPQAHITHLKPMPAADEIVDKCIECGFCEPVCPSRNLTFTPRHRITAWREAKRLENGSGARKWKRGYQYPGLETCAADGLCAQRCPVGINTGTFTKKQRAEATGKMGNRTASFLADHYNGTTRTVRAGLKGAHMVHKLAGDGIMEAVAMHARRLSLKTLPMWNRALPDAAGKMRKLKGKSSNPLKVVYFPSCISRSFGASLQMEDKRPLGDVTLSVLEKAGYDVIIPEGLNTLCCGLPFASKGYTRQADKKAAELEKALMAASRDGEYPILADTSPCLYHMKETLSESLALYEPVGFILEFLKKRLIFNQSDDKIAVHATCTTLKLGLEGKLKELAELCAARVVVPEDINCCGFAGDRGFNVPELNEAALDGLKDQVAGCREGFSTSRTCEIGLSLHGGITYSSILYLVDRCTERIVRTGEM
ncbi:FAD-binding and (Fe-S)-binding domain-containing protein [Desulfoluna butyratoxydans]|uniref:D-lactate dehydrogenase (cytochrome) n=1 Tax=Desulfoluna butyratoxydans TaxID=231438 RepID=A0A4U8YQZ0_9BACT|nr:FAD-binding and (Fe-S)-binding domain-containing protein [Desulfoluna butyratoxydans]VFQ46745.1 alpha-helical ferredoxin [Desulfoluna butyratoxydans]